MKKNIILYVLGLGALYFFTRKSSTSTTTTDTEDAGTPDLGNGSTPTPTPSGPQASTPPVEVLKPSTPPVVVRQASTPPVVVRQASTPMPPMPRVQGRSNMPNEVNSSSQQVMYASTSPSMGEPKNVYSM